MLVTRAALNLNLRDRRVLENPGQPASHGGLLRPGMNRYTISHARLPRADGSLFVLGRFGLASISRSCGQRCRERVSTDRMERTIWEKHFMENGDPWPRSLQ